MYNGIMDDSGRGNTQTWERPWTTEEMRKQSSHWNLAGDAGLLQFLQEFSQRMISKTHEVEQMVNSLCHETKVTNARVSNVVNDFHMLSNTQFVESRVYDEDVQEVIKEEKPLEKTKQERENEVVEKISNALNLGLNVMDQAFERVEFQDSDSEDEDSPAHREVLFQPKDPYYQRLLPHLIGSHAFLQDDYVGIGDISSEDEEVKNDKEDSEVSSDDEYVPDIKNTDKLKIPIRDEYESESVSGGSDMFNEKDELFDESSQSSEDEDFNQTGNRQDEVDKSNQSPLLAEELDARIKQYSQKSPRKSIKNSETQSIKSRQSVRTISKSVVKAPSEEDLFGSAMPDDDENDLFGKKGGLFSGTGKLFDESQENSGLFAEVPKPNPEPKDTNKEKLLTPKNRGYTQSGKKIPVGGVSAVGGNDLFGEVNENGIKFSAPAVEKKHSVLEPTQRVEPVKVPVPQKQTGGLFDSDDNEDDLFTAPRKASITSQASKDIKVVTKNKPLKEGKQSGHLFSSDEEDSDLFSIPKTTSNSSVPTSTEKKKLAGGVSMFGSLVNEIGNAIKSKRPQADSDSDTEKSEDISESRDSASLKSHSSYQAKKAGIKDSRSNSVSSNSLFADDPEIDDLFTKKEPVKKPSKISTSLFGDDDEDDFDSLFSSKAIPTSNQSSLAVTTQVKTASKTLSLFENIDEEDLFSTRPSAGLSLTREEEVQKLAPVPEKKEAEKAQIIQAIPKDIPAQKISLFDDSQDGDLFSSSSKLSQSPTSFDKSPEEKSPGPSEPSETPKVRSTSLFDDDVLFGGQNEESPEVDLFKSIASVKKPEVNENKPAVPTSSPSKKPIGGVALFGGVDLFGGQSSLKPTAISQEVTNDSAEPEPVINSQSEIRKRPPMLKDTKEISVSFDEPVDISNTLQSAAKDRVKVQTKRRPPSRRGRQAAANQHGIDHLSEFKEEKSEMTHDVLDSSSLTKKFEGERQNQDSPSKSLSKTEKAINTAVASKPTPFLAVSADFRSPSTEEEDLFSVMDPPDKGLLSNTREKVKKNLASSKPTTEESIDSDADLFGSGLNPNPITVESVEPVKEIVSAKGPQDLFKKCNKPQQPAKNRSIFDDEEDNNDIFSVSNSIKGTSDNDAKKSLSAKVKDSVITDADVDDIFKAVPSKKAKLPKLSSMSKSIFDDDDDDSDIFSTKTVMASSSKTSSSGSSKQPIKSTGKRKESLVKKNVTHSTDVFDDPLLAAQNDKD